VLAEAGEVLVINVVRLQRGTTPATRSYTDQISLGTDLRVHQLVAEARRTINQPSGVTIPDQGVGNKNRPRNR
jgi:hypothetical protein